MTDPYVSPDSRRWVPDSPPRSCSPTARVPECSISRSVQRLVDQLAQQPFGKGGYTVLVDPVWSVARSTQARGISRLRRASPASCPSLRSRTRPDRRFPTWRALIATALAEFVAGWRCHGRRMPADRPRRTASSGHQPHRALGQPAGRALCRRRPRAPEPDRHGRPAHRAGDPAEQLVPGPTDGREPATRRGQPGQLTPRCDRPVGRRRDRQSRPRWDDRDLERWRLIDVRARRDRGGWNPARSPVPRRIENELPRLLAVVLGGDAVERHETRQQTSDGSSTGHPG